VPDYELSPDTFLGYAELDFESGGTRGYINALSNAKRAMDCQVDGIIAVLGFDPASLRRQLSRELIGFIENDSIPSTLPFNYRFLESLGGVTPVLVDRVRRLRHDVEHRFQRPTRRSTREAIDVARLFVAAAKSLTIDFWEQFGIGSIDPESKTEYEFMFNMKLEEAEPFIDAAYVTRPGYKRDGTTDVRVLPNHPAYYWLIRIGLILGEGGDAQPLVRNLVASTGARIPKRSIKVMRYG
jgi:hypothetical protein